MTPNEITAVIAEPLSRQLDMAFRIQLMERVKVWRSRLVANSLQKHPAQRKFFRQTVYLKMEKTTAVPCAPEVSCPVARTIVEVPLPIRVGSSLFDYVGGVDGNSPFREVTPGMESYVNTSRFSHLFHTYKYTNRYITTPNSDLPLLMVDGIFDDPMAVQELSCRSQGIPCDMWDSTYPVSGDLLQLIIQNIQYVDYRRPGEVENHEVPVTQPNDQR